MPPNMKTKKISGRYDVELGEVTVHNVAQLKKVNQLAFPVSYNDKFYADIAAAGELAKLVYFNDIVVGGVCCRVDVKDGRKRMYIMTLACLAPYRRLGLGTLMLNHVFSLCERDKSIETVFLHVQVSNEDALKFYRHFGFEVVETATNYYRRIEPADAYVVEKVLLQRSSCSSSSSSSSPPTGAAAQPSQSATTKNNNSQEDASNYEETDEQLQQQLQNGQP